MAAQRHGVRALLSAHVTRNRFGLAPLDVAAQTLDVLEPYFAVFALGLERGPALLGVLLAVKFERRLHGEPLGADVAHPAGAESVRGLLVGF